MKLKHSKEADSLSIEFKEGLPVDSIDIKQVLKLLRNKMTYLSAEFNVKKIGIFGSYAKGLPGKTSDIDIIVEFHGPVGFKFIELTDYLEKLLGKKVDILTPAGLQGIRVPRIAQSIEENILYV